MSTEWENIWATNRGFLISEEAVGDEKIRIMIGTAYNQNTGGDLYDYLTIRWSEEIRRRRRLDRKAKHDGVPV